MFIFDWFKNLEKKFPVGVISLILAAIFFIITIYLQLYEKKPCISYEVKSETNVLDVRKPLKELSILFKGEDIQTNNLNLRIYTIRIENIGQVNILPDQYDANIPWGFQIENGKIIEARLVDSNSDYLTSNINLGILNDDSVKFNKIIFEKGKFFIVEILVIHSKDRLPKFKPFGKIAGIDTLDIKPFSAKHKKGIIYETFRGKILVQLCKLIAYFLFGLAIIILVVFGFDKCDSWKERRAKRVRKRHVLSLFGEINEKEYRGKKIATDIYINQGIDSVEEINNLLKNKEKLKLKIDELRIERKIKELENKKIHPSWEPFVYRFDLVANLVDSEILSIDNKEVIIVDPLFKESIEQILSYELETQKSKKGTRRK